MNIIIDYTGLMLIYKHHWMEVKLIIDINEIYRKTFQNLAICVAIQNIK